MIKYCPKCGNLLDGKKECSCGFTIDEEIISNNSSAIVTNWKTGMMNPFQDNGLDYLEISFEKNKLDRNRLLSNLHLLNIKDLSLVETFGMSQENIIDYCLNMIQDYHSNIVFHDNKIYCKNGNIIIVIHDDDYSILNVINLDENHKK